MNAKMGTSISNGLFQITYVSAYHDYKPVSVDTWKPLTSNRYMIKICED
jgi:hypothetical protein